MKSHLDKCKPGEPPVAQLILSMGQVEAIHRGLGIIEGISCGVDNNAANGLVTAVEMIDGVLNDARSNS